MRKLFDYALRITGYEYEHHPMHYDLPELEEDLLVVRETE